MTDDLPANDPPLPDFDHVVFKRLSIVEADRSRSNQHEFNGTAPLRRAFGPDPRRITTDFVRMADDGSWTTASGDLTWYDARAMHPTRTEYRLYYRTNAVTSVTNAGDVLLLAVRSDGTALALIAPGSGLAAARIFWLFGIEIAPGAGFAALNLDPAKQQNIAARLGLGRRAEQDVWSSEAPFDHLGGNDPELRRKTGDLQRLVGTTKSSLADSSDWIPEDAPAALGGEGLALTIRGILAPHSER